MIPQAFIDDLLSRVDVTDVVGRHVKLRKAGANLQGLCPFHSEKTPSFTVSPSKQFYHCFGCGAHGSAIGFLMEHAGLGYVDAIEELAQSVGLTVPHESGQGMRRQRSDAPDLVALLTSAARYYQRRLKESQKAIDYLKGRGLSGVTAGRFGLGFAPPGWRNLEAAVADYDSAALVRAGLVKDDSGEADASGSESRRKRYDRFRDRIMFPIRNPRGGIIGFGGRLLGEGEPKYLNSPETPVFSKGRELYGLYEARTALRESNQAIVVEGYMDVVMLAEHGVSNAVATLGTATTADHLRKLLRMVDDLVFCFDGDRAGKKAAWRALQTCLPIVSDTQRVAFLFLPDGEDPDSFIRAHGPQGWRRALDAAQPLSGFIKDRLTAQGDLHSPEGRARLLAQARPLLAAFRADAMRMQMAREIADLAGIGLVELNQYVDKQPAPERPGHRPDPPVSTPGAANAGARRSRQRYNSTRRAAVRPGLPNLTRRLRLLLVCHPQLCADVPAELLAESDQRDDLTPWIAALQNITADRPLASTLEVLRQAQLDGIAELERDLATDWGSVTQLDADEARREMDGALVQMQKRANLRAARRAAEQLQESGLADTENRRELLRLLESRKNS